jgi:hypothetical protein
LILLLCCEMFADLTMCFVYCACRVLFFFQVLHFLSTTDECLNEPEKWNIPDDEVDDMDDCTLFSESFSM